AVASPPAVAQEKPQSTTDQPSAEVLKQRDEWRVAMAQTPLPKKGCFEGSFPNRQWREVACVKAPDYPMDPKSGPTPLTVGKNNDITAVAPSGTISTAIGSFDAVSVTSETSQVAGTGPQVADAYTMQVNTNFMDNTTLCMGAADPSVCKVWEQFV